MGLRAIILGCGSSGGVPRIGGASGAGDWGACDPSEPKNTRSRSSILIQVWEGDGDMPSEKNCTSVLVDTAPDLRTQFLREKISRLDALFCTHDHADQLHGMDDLRAVAYGMAKRIPTYMEATSKADIFNRFGYCFETPKGLMHPPILELKDTLKNGDAHVISGAGGDIIVKSIGVEHGAKPVLGFIFNDALAYTPDVWEIDETVLAQLEDLDSWIVDALRYSHHPTHAHADRALSWIARTRVKTAIITNLHIDMDYATLCEELPPRVKPAYDGMIISLP